MAMKYRIISGTPNTNSVYWATAGHGITGDYKPIEASLIADGLWHVVYMDMWYPTIGGTDWKDNVVTTVRIDPIAASGALIDFAYISVSNLETSGLT